MAFEWETDEGAGFEEPPDAPEPTRPRRWPYLLIVLLAIALIALGAWRHVQERAASALRSLEEDVRSSQRLLWRATAQQDEELLAPLLSGSEPAWATAQRDLFSAGLFLEQAARALSLEPLDSAPAITEISFNPELSEATVTVQHGYVFTTTHGLRQSVQLVRASVFRQGDQRWLLSPPHSDYWGEWRFAGGSHVRLTYPQRDEAFALELLPYLREKVDALCAAEALQCPEKVRLTVRLEGAPQTVLNSAGSDWLTTGSYEVVLPTPSLIGLPAPEDEDGREALLVAYAARSIAALNAALVDYRCCGQRDYFESLQYARLGQLGLYSWPPGGGDFSSFVEQPLSRQRLSELWWSPERHEPTVQERKQLLAFVDFLLQSPETTIAALQKGLVQGYGFRTWVHRLTPHDPALGQNEFEEAWHAFVLERANATQGDVARPDWPEQKLAVVCRSFLARYGLYTVELPDGRMTPLARLSSRIPWGLPLPGDKGMAVFDRSGGETREPVELWQAGEMIQLEPELLAAGTAAADPQGRYLSAWRVGDGASENEAVLLDTAACSADAGCPLLPLPGLPVWSPDGEHFLLLDALQGLVVGKRESWALEVVDGEAIRSPFWIDDSRYGYVAVDGRTLRLREMGTPAVRTLNIIDMQPVLRGSEEGRNWQFAEILPVAGDRLLVTLTLPHSQLRHFFLVSDAGGPQQAMEPILYAPLHSILSPDAMVSPDGRWLFAHLVAGEITNARFILYDLLEREIALDIDAPYFVGSHFNDWSADGRWMARLGRRFIEVLAPAEDGSGELFRHFISTDNLQCSAVAWVGPSEVRVHP